MARLLVFVLEDSPLLSTLLSDALRAHGVGDEVRVFRNAAAARAGLDAALQGPDRVGLFVIDIELPGEDGLSFGRFVREAERAAGAGSGPIVFFSSREQAPEIDAAVSDCFPARFVRKVSEEGPAAVALEGARMLKRMLEGGPA